MLTAGEVVLNAAQQGNLANVIGSREKGGDTYLIIQNPSFYGDDKAFAEKVGDQILETLKYHVSFSN